MNAVCRIGYQKYKLLEVPFPEIKSKDDVLIRVKCCSDSARVRNGILTSEEDPYGYLSSWQPEIMGVGFSGIVEGAGENSSLLYSEGDRVTGFYRQSCGSCFYCLNGNEHMCENFTYPTRTMAEYVVRRSSILYRLPDDVDFDEACFTIAVARLLRAIEVGQVQYGSSVVVLGNSYYALILIKLLKLVNAGHIVLLSSSEKIRTQALKMGADYAYDPDTERLSNILSPLKNPYIGFKTMIDLEGDPHRIQKLLIIMAKQGNVVIPVCRQNTSISLPMDVLYMDEINIRIIKDDPKYMQRAVDLLPKLKLKELITEQLSLKDAPKLFSAEFYKENLQGIVYI